MYLLWWNQSKNENWNSIFEIKIELKDSLMLHMKDSAAIRRRDVGIYQHEGQTLFQTVTGKSCVSLMYNVITPRDTNSSNSEHLASSKKEFTWKGLFWTNLPGFENRDHQVPPQKLFPPHWCPTSHVAPVSYSARVLDAHWPRATEGL